MTPPLYTQDFVDSAHASLILDRLQRFGVVSPTWAINPKRCRQILERAAMQGMEPRPDAYSRFLDELREDGIPLPS